MPKEAIVRLLNQGIRQLEAVAHTCHFSTGTMDKGGPGAQVILSYVNISREDRPIKDPVSKKANSVADSLPHCMHHMTPVFPKHWLLISLRPRARMQNLVWLSEPW